MEQNDSSVHGSNGACGAMMENNSPTTRTVGSKLDSNKHPLIMYCTH